MPVAIVNNTGGEDRKILRQFGEPAWNYQVVRFLNSDGRDIIPRRDRVWTLPALAERMRAALTKAKQPIPEALKEL